MNIQNVLAIILTLLVTIIALKELKNFKFNIKSIVRIALIASITMVLWMIRLVPFPQGGGCSLLSIVPIMLLSSIYGIGEGIICAIVVAIIKIIFQPPYFPMQIPLDYLGSMIAVAFAPMFGSENRLRLIIGASIASIISIIFCILSGVIFFGEFTPQGMNVWVYSIIYNVLGYGVEAGLSIVFVAVLPIKHLKRSLKI